LAVGGEAGIDRLVDCLGLALVLLFFLCRAWCERRGYCFKPVKTGIQCGSFYEPGHRVSPTAAEIGEESSFCFSYPEPPSIAQRNVVFDLLLGILVPKWGLGKIAAKPLYTYQGKKLSPRKCSCSSRSQCFRLGLQNEKGNSPAGRGTENVCLEGPGSMNPKTPESPTKPGPRQASF